MKYIWILPFISSFIGWITNFIAIKMLFRPHRPFKLLGIFKIQGVVFKRKDDLARKIADTVESHLFNKDDISNAIETNGQNGFENLIEERLDDFINKRLFSFNPMIASFINDDLKIKIKNILLKEILNLMPDIGEKIKEKIENNIDIKKIVYEKIISFDFIKLENIILQIASKELRTVELWGAVLGFIIGLVQIGLLMIN